MDPINPFTRKAEDYTRDIDVISGAIKQYSLYIYKSYIGQGKDVALNDVVDFVIDEFWNGELAFQDPTFYVLDQDENQDRHKATYPFTTMLKDVVDNNLIMTPTFTQYVPPEQKESVLSRYIVTKLKSRDAEKGLQQEAKRKGNFFQASIHNNNQNNEKILVNAISGNHRSEHSILCDKAIHPVLTSSCRIANGSANSNDDRLISGNRHYYSRNVVLENLASIVSLSDFKVVRDAIESYKLHVPTVDEVYAMIVRCSEPYWKIIGAKRQIMDFLNGCNDLERAAILYTGDLKSIATYNEALVRDLFDPLINRATVPIEDHERWWSIVDSDTKHQVMAMFHDVLGRNKVTDQATKEHPAYPLIGTTCYQIYAKLDYYKHLINAFFMSKNVPFLISDFPSAIREAGVGSDTDSAIFTVQDWVAWFNDDGNTDITIENMIRAEAVGFFVSQVTTHNLATLTVNIGVKGEEVFRLKMKNEYLFPVFILTSRAKHYAASMAIQEGVIFEEPEMETKGVELIGSNLPDISRNEKDYLLRDIIEKITNSEEISLTDYLVRAARIEHQIYDSLTLGQPDYLKSARVKEEEGYSKEVQNTRFINYLMWQEVFADKYGDCPEPPYSALSFSITPDTKNKTNKWLDSWEDQERAGRMRKWLASRNKDYLGEILLPEGNLLSYGVPEELLGVIDVRKIVAKAMSSIYLILESLEFYLFDDKQNKLIMDMISKEDIAIYEVRKTISEAEKESACQ